MFFWQLCSYSGLPDLHCHDLFPTTFLVDDLTRRSAPSCTGPPPRLSPNPPFTPVASARIHFGQYCSRHLDQGCIYPITYVDDIVITGSDHQGILQVKQHFSRHFQTKDLGKLRYFLDFEATQSKDGLVISPRKYAMDILDATSLFNAKPFDTSYGSKHQTSI